MDDDTKKIAIPNPFGQNVVMPPYNYQPLVIHSSHQTLKEDGTMVVEMSY